MIKRPHHNPNSCKTTLTATRMGFVCFVAIALGIASAFVSKSAQASKSAKITDEKSCNVKIDSNEFTVGQKIAVVKEKDGVKKRIAIIQISRISGANALGKVVQGPKKCAPLRGLSVEASKTKSKGKKAASRLAKIDTSFKFGMTMTTGKGLHQKSTTPSVKLTLFGFEIGGDVYPLMYAGDSPFFPMIGIGASYRTARAYPDIEVTSPDGDTTKTGKQQSNPTDLQFDLIGRFAYLDEQMATEVRLGYLSHSLTHKLAAGATLERSPLRDIHLSGFGIGLKQRYRPIPMFLINAGFKYPILSGTVDNTSELNEDKAARDKGKLKSPTGIMFDASGDFILKFFKVTAGVEISQFGGAVLLKDNSLVKVVETDTFLYLGIGVLL